MLGRPLMGINAYWGELEALMKAVFQEIRVLLSPSECDGGHTTMGHAWGRLYSVTRTKLASVSPIGIHHRLVSIPRKDTLIRR